MTFEFKNIRNTEQIFKVSSSIHLFYFILLTKLGSRQKEISYLEKINKYKNQ